jgi:hypothetical protein
MFLRLFYIAYLVHLVSSYFFPSISELNLLVKEALSPLFMFLMPHYSFILILIFTLSVYSLFLSVSSCKNLSDSHFFVAILVVLRTVVFFIIFSFNLYLTFSSFYYYQGFSSFLEYFFFITVFIDGPGSCTEHVGSALTDFAERTRHFGFRDRGLIMDEYSEKGKVFLEELSPLSSPDAKPVVAYDRPFTRVADLQLYYKVPVKPIYDPLDPSSKCFHHLERVDQRLRLPHDTGHTCVELERSVKPGHHRFYIKPVPPERVIEFLRNP